MRLLAIVTAACTLAACGRAETASAPHPLDVLSPHDIQVAVQVMKADARLTKAASPLITLAEPPKGDVLAWTPGRELPRHARAVAMAGSSVFEAVVDVSARRPHRGAGESGATGRQP